MTKETYLKFRDSLTSEHENKFQELAEAIVDYDIKKLDGSSLEGSERLQMICNEKISLVFGSEFTKKRYLLTGGLIGGAVVISAFVINNIIKKKKKVRA
jgi:hypothetical protein